MPIILRKHLRFIAIVAISIFGFALSAKAGENSLTISGPTILPGQAATIAVNLHNVDNCYGLQFDITMPEGLSLTGVSKTDRTSNCVLTPNLNSGKERVVLLSLSNPLSGSNGDVCELKVQASPTFKGGILKIANAKMSDGGTSDITIPSTQCEILNVKNATVILPDFSITAGESKSVGVNIKAEGNVAGLQVDLYLPNELTIDLSSIALSGSASDFILDKQQHNGYIRVLIFSLSNAVIFGNLDDAFSFAVKADERASGITEIKLQNISISSQTGVSLPLESSQTKVTINKPKASSITLSPASAILKVGEQQQIAATILPENAANKELLWSIDNPAIATVDKTGLVHAIGLGTAIITATSKDDTEVKATCQITVVATPAGSITLNKTKATLKATETVDLVATILPETTTDKSITWKSSNEAIATVDANGKVTAVAVGKATITATAASGIFAECAITVVETPAGSITIDKDALGITGDNLEMRVGDVKAIKVTVIPETTTDKAVTYSSENPSVASVDENGNVTALSLGTTTITIVAKSTPDVKSTINVTVVATPAGSITLNKTEATLKATETIDLVATILPETTTDKSVAWKSSDEAIATVDANGKVTAVAVGKATITATAASGIFAECAITVVETPAGSITIDKDALGITGDNLEMRVGDVKAIKVIVTPETTTDKAVTYSSENPSVASVDENGNVTALSLGTTTITIVAKSTPDVKSTINVTVVATPAGSITLNKTEATLKATETIDLVATILPETTTDKSVAWKSSDENIATVDANGKVTAVAVGKATITATAASGISAECAITVVETTAGGITIDKDALGITGDNLEMKVGESKSIKVTVTPETTTDKSVTYSSENPSVASVDENGNVKALALGTTTITITSKSTPEVKATINVTVVATPAGSISLNKTEATLKASETVDLVATIHPETTTDKSVTWKSSDENIATVDANGKVTAVAVGKATITATAASGISAGCAITVVETTAGGITIDKDALGITGDNLEMKVGESKSIKVTVTPETTTDKSVTYESSNPSVASVDENGNVTALSLGTSAITITAKSNPEVKATINVTVVATPAGSISLNKTEATLKATETVDLVATILPETTTDKTVTWKSSDETIATVDANGKVTAVAVGKATITATAASGISAGCAITVVETTAGGITIDKDALGITGDNLEMRVGDVKAIKVTVAPETTTDKAVTYSSENPAVASVDDNGNVTALSLGTSAITITAKSNPDVKATINVTVVATPAGSITLNKTEATLKATETVDLVATILPETTTDKTVTWKSSDETIATVDANGKVTAVAVGKATITATAASGISAECAINVVETPAGGITIDKDTLGITGDNLEMKVGESKSIKVTVTPETTTDKSVAYESSNPSVASVDDNGNVTALSLGTSAITITAKSNPDVKATINVTVVATPAGAITLNKTEATLKATETVDLVATILPETTTDKTVTWKSSDETIATVDANGKVTAVAVGKATITATAASGISAGCAITVVETPAGGITIDKDALGITGDNLEMKVGESKSIKVTVTPETTTDKSVTYESSNPSVASVDENGNVTALSLGSTTITITSKSNPAVNATINVTVVATPAGSMSLNKTEATLKATETVDLVATILPGTTTDKSVTWKSSDEAIATVDANGKVTAVAVGKATITATSASGIFAECAITVIETPAGGITIDKDALGITGDNLEMRVGEVKAINVTVTPEATTDKSVTYESSNPSVASVDENGNVTALSLGTSAITITAKSNPKVKATINVTVVATLAGAITLNKTEATLKATETVDLVATILPETTTDKTVTWKSSDETIATVDANGKVTAVAVGKATITATATTGIEATCAITVVATHAESIALNCEDATIRVNETIVLNATIAPDQTTDKIVVWKSSDENIASVYANGVVTGLYSGVATITATAASGVTASCTVTVLPRETAPITVIRSNEKMIIMDGESAEMSVNITGGHPEGLTFAWSNGGNTVGSANSLTVVGRSNGNKKSNEFYRVRVVDVCDGVTLLDETYQFEVETWPQPATDVTIETDSDTDNLKIREGNLLELSAENPAGGYADNWGFDWYLDGTKISSEPEMSRVMTMSEGTERATEKAVVTLTASNIGPDGTVWGEATSTPLNVTIYRRPLTPKQLLRKGDGTTCTVVAMSQYTDTDLASLGYTFVYGYTDADGEDHVVATTAKRYCRLDKAVFNNVDCEKWCYSQWIYADGSVVTSGKRYLDGRADENFDGSDFSGSANPKKSIDFSDSNNWIRSNGKNINISIETTDEARVDVYSIAGTLIDSVEIPADTFMSVDYTSDRLVPNFYIISVTTADKRVVKKVFIK